MRPDDALAPGGALRRLVAFGLDQLICGGLWLLVAAWTGVVYVSVSRWPADFRSLAALAWLLGLFGIVLNATYWTVFVGGCGQTPGKMILGLVVVARDGSAVGYVRAALRWVAMAIALLPFGFGYLGVMLAPEKRGLHDLLAGTRVVRVAPLSAATRGVGGLTPLSEPTP